MRKKGKTKHRPLMTFSCNWEILMRNYWEIDFCFVFFQTCQTSVVKWKIAEKSCFLVETLKTFVWFSTLKTRLHQQKKNSVHFCNPSILDYLLNWKQVCLQNQIKSCRPNSSFSFMESKYKLSPLRKTLLKRGLTSLRFC